MFIQHEGTNPTFYAKDGKIYFKHQLDARFVVERPARKEDAEAFPEEWKSAKLGTVKKCLS